MIRKIQFCLKTTIWIKNTLTKWGKTQIIQTSPTGRSMQNISIHSNEYGQFCCNTKEEHCDKSTICNGSCNNFQFNFLYKINYSLSLRNGFQSPCFHSLFPFFFYFLLYHSSVSPVSILSLRFPFRGYDAGYPF